MTRLDCSYLYLKLIFHFSDAFYTTLSLFVIYESLPKTVYLMFMGDGIYILVSTAADTPHTDSQLPERFEHLTRTDLHIPAQECTGLTLPVVGAVDERVWPNTSEPLES